MTVGGAGGAGASGSADTSTPNDLNNNEQNDSAIMKDYLDIASDVVGKASDVISDSGIGNLNEGITEFAEKGSNITKTKTPLKSTGEFKYYDNGWKGNAHVKTEHIFNPKVMKGFARTSPVLGATFNIIEAEDIALTAYKEGKLGVETKTKIAKVSGAMAGGATAATICGAAGSVIGPVGTVVGASICTPIGSWIGEAFAEDVANEVLKEEK